MNFIKSLALITVAGIPLSFIGLVYALWVRPFGFGSEMIAIDAFICAVFTMVSILTLKNAQIVNEKQVRLTFISVICFLLLPVITLPFIFWWYELIIWLVCIIVALWLLFKIKVPRYRLVFVSLISLIILTFNVLVVIGHLY